MRTILAILLIFIVRNTQASNDTESRNGKQFSLFSVVSFTNQECNATGNTGEVGTCYTSGECSGRSGSASGSCAAGFGVCCVTSCNTCGCTISSNTSYIRNPNYPSSYTPTSAGTCTYTIQKTSADICQLRLDFVTMNGFTTTTTPNPGQCQDTFVAAGQTGVNPPTICGTNTGYHMYIEFGTLSTDSITLTNTWAAAGLTTAKNYNILARQIRCTDTFKAPPDCVQWFTGITGTVENYNHQGGQLLNSQNYQNCIRTEKGYCRIQWKQNPATTPDPFQMLTNNAIDATACNTALITIPNLSPDGNTPIPVAGVNPLAFQTEACGNDFGIEGGVAQALVSSQQPFVLGTFTSGPATSMNAMTGYKMDYTQLAC